MKIVVNACHGVFALSNVAVEMLVERGALRADFATHDDNGKLRSPLRQNTLYNSHVVHDDEIARNDARLIEVVEMLGDTASGSLSRLRIVEIPDDVLWEIENYDGFERVSERHRTWSAD